MVPPIVLCDGRVCSSAGSLSTQSTPHIVVGLRVAFDLIESPARRPGCEGVLKSPEAKRMVR